MQQPFCRAAKELVLRLIRAVGTKDETIDVILPHQMLNFDHWATGSGSAADCVDSPASAADPILRVPGGSLRCELHFAPCAATDPEDLDLDPKGDPALDIRCLASGTEKVTRSWVRVGTMGSWPPPDVFSWFVTVRVFGASGELGSYTRELHDGVARVITTGMLTLIFLMLTLTV